MAIEKFGLKYTSTDIYRCIDFLFGGSSRKLGRRVAIVAYVGADALSMLPNPQGVQIICSPTPGATSATAIGKLTERGADVSFADSLHMKLYWSAGRGCLITSANLSKNALGRGGLSEAGYFISDADVPIDKIIRSLGKLVPAAGVALARLEKEGRAHDAAQSLSSKVKRVHLSFVDWYAEHQEGARAVGMPWKIGWWAEDNLEASKVVRKRANDRIGESEPHEFLNVAKGQVTQYDWLLTFQLGARLNCFGWQFAEDVVPVSPSDRKAYEAEYPFQVVQYRKDALCPTPPFKLDKRFRDAFNFASKTLYGSHDWIWTLKRLAPSEELLALVDQKYRSL